MSSGQGAGMGFVGVGGACPWVEAAGVLRLLRAKSVPVDAIVESWELEPRPGPLFFFRWLPNFSRS